MRKSNLCKQRIGEKRKNNQGLDMVIIDYIDCDHITVKFPQDGTVVKNKQYANFKKGCIENKNARINNYLGMTECATNGQKMTIVTYRNSQDIDVKFEDGTIVEHKKMNSFKNGMIENPNAPLNRQISYNEFVCQYYFAQIGFYRYSRKFYKDLGLGKREYDLYNQDLKIAIEYDGYKHNEKKDSKKNEISKQYGIKLYRIREHHLPVLKNSYSENYILESDAKFGDELLKNIVLISNDIIKNNNLDTEITISKEKDKMIIDELYSSYQQAYKHEGEIVKNSKGEQMEIVKYVDSKHCTVMFEDGTLQYNVRYDHFLSGKVRNENAMKKERIGGELKMMNGQMAKITDYRGCDDIDVRFEDGTIKQHVTYGAFKDGRVKNINFISEKRNGEIFTNHDGFEAEIVNYINAREVYVRFKDGSIIRRRYEDIKNGNFKHPKIKNKVSILRIGEEQLSSSKEMMRIVEYRNAKDIDVEFSDGTIVTHKRYEHFKNGLISKK